MTYLVTGGAGFIGSALVRALIADGQRVVVLDALTYAGSRSNLAEVLDSDLCTFVKGDICDSEHTLKQLREHGVDKIMHLAAESHVDRGIDAPDAFIQTNFVGTFRLLGAALAYYRELDEAGQARFLFHHISTDEVYGDLGPNDPAFEETTPYNPRSPYSASKAGSDFLVNAWHHTYDLPTLITNCSNNYGPYQHPEKLIPKTIANALAERPIGIYGTGENVRDWLHVDDHVSALLALVQASPVGETFNIGGNAERTNNQVVAAITAALDKLHARSGGASYADLVTYITDRPGHDRRYAINPDKLHAALGWTPAKTFETGIEETVAWYLNNQTWIQEHS